MTVPAVSAGHGSVFADEPTADAVLGRMRLFDAKNRTS